MRTKLLTLALLSFGMCTTNPDTTPETSLVSTLLSGKLIDLTYAYDSTTIYWPTEEGFMFETGTEGYTDKGYYYTANSFCSAEHGGTHLDAPIHFAEGKQTVDEISLQNLVGSAIVVDVSEEAANQPDYQVSAEDFQEWEAEHGEIPDGAIVLIRTGYGRYWPNRLEYMGTDERGIEAVSKLHFPGLHPDAVRWLIENRSIKSVGLDTPSIDYGQSNQFESHQQLFQENIPAFENVANLEQLPIQGFVVIALPMKIGGGSGAPLRIVAIVPES